MTSDSQEHETASRERARDLWRLQDYPAKDELAAWLEKPHRDIAVRITKQIHNLVDIWNGLYAVNKNESGYTVKVTDKEYRVFQYKTSAKAYSLAAQMILLNMNGVSPVEVLRAIQK
jgi:hypothetical protein